MLNVIIFLVGALIMFYMALRSVRGGGTAAAAHQGRLRNRPR